MPSQIILPPDAQARLEMLEKNQPANRDSEQAKTDKANQSRD